MSETYQGQSNAYVAYKKQVGKGTRASGAGGKILSTSGGTGGQFSKNTTADPSVRRDGMSSRGRHGTPKTAGSWDVPTTIDAMIDIPEAVVRDNWDVADLVIDHTDFTSLTTTLHTIVAASGDFIALGLRVGDIIVPEDLPDADNNGIPIRISGLTANTITTPDELVVNAVAAAGASITRPRKLIQFAAGELVKRYFTIDEHEADVVQSEVIGDLVWASLKLSMSPDGIISMTVTGTGTGDFDALDSDAAPLLTNPIESTKLVLAVVDSSLRLGGEDVTDLSSWDLTITNQAMAPTTFGQRGVKVSPDVFTGAAQISLNWTALRKDLTAIQAFKAETQFEMHVLAVDPTTGAFFSIYVGNYSLGQAQKSALSNQAGPRTTAVQVPAALVGKDNRGGAYDPTMVKFQYWIPA